MARRRLSEHGPDGVVELPDAAETGGEGHVGGPEFGRLEQDPRRLRPLGPRQLEWPGADLGDEQPLQLAGAVAETSGQSGHPFAVHHAVDDRPHGPADDVATAVPLR